MRTSSDEESPTAFDAPSGTIWQYAFIVSSHKLEETLFLVLPGRQTVYTGTSLTVFRQYLDLLSGDYEWFAEGSAMNRRSSRFV